jgi:hypothetical protein
MPDALAVISDVHGNLPYDTASAARAARRNGRSDWASAIESGWSAEAL